MRREFNTVKQAPMVDQFSASFITNEIDEAIGSRKPGKAQGFDGNHPEFLVNCGAHTRKWLLKLLSNILYSKCLPKEFKRTKIIALLKPGKPQYQANSFRPIALFSACYNLLERLLYNRISPSILESVPIEQAGFRLHRSCEDQVLALIKPH
ncbi:hypothetical protein J437_LFUL014545 [Ladona fulva]|uniref:Reverse transcriptase domain-containing protein n=1 Tax=Ladona fulva TaxID=123851 RepID=A0A8K0KL89_LADFU|nr:hypothetical protein J437_LFUL014545 [Ladona fulva]